MASVSPRRRPYAPDPVLDAPPGAGPGSLPATERRPAVARTAVPVVPPKVRRRRVVQGRRVRRVVRRIDAWTVLKLSFMFYLSVALVLMIAGVILWNIASTFNVIHNVEKFIRSLLDLQTFTLRPRVIFESGAAMCGLVVILGTGINVLTAVLYNLMSDIVGGIQVIVLEEAEEPVAAGASTSAALPPPRPSR
jgi:Transmembrane domain of unknown function (DUF3566)